MAKTLSVNQEVKDEIIRRALAGEKTADLAREVGVKVGLVYNWIYYFKLKNEDTPREPRVATPPLTIQERILLLNNEHTEKLKALWIMELTSNLKNM